MGWVCADLGCSSGGFVDCLLQFGALRVYAIDRGYGVLDNRLRSDPRAVVMERTDALHVVLPEPVQLVTIDTGWTRQARVLPVARRLLAAGGRVIVLVKPHYEAPPEWLREGVAQENKLQAILEGVGEAVARCGLILAGETESPIRGRGGNREFLWHLLPG